MPLGSNGRAASMTTARLGECNLSPRIGPGQIMSASSCNTNATCAVQRTRSPGRKEDWSGYRFCCASGPKCRESVMFGVIDFYKAMKTDKVKRIPYPACSFTNLQFASLFVQQLGYL